LGWDHEVNRAAVLFSVTAILCVLRIVWVLHVPDVDMDAYGHFGIARGLCLDPWNLGAHWVWLPLYHYLLMTVACVGAPFVVARIASSLMIAAIPIVVYRWQREPVGFFAALLCACASIVNLLGVSAQQEALFSLLVVLAAWAIDARRFTVVGVLVATACLIRYEAWGAAGLLMAQPIIARITQRFAPLPWRVPALPLVAIAGWIVLHRIYEGGWFVFLSGLVRYTHAQRDVLSQGPIMEALWFPVFVPALTLGPAVVLAPLGVRRAFTLGWVVPLGIYLFLLASYVGKGALGGPRYYGSIMPFFCIAIARASTGAERWKSWLRVGAVASLVSTTAIAFVRLDTTARANLETLHDAEARMNAPRAIR
jgi:hypothetical protein